MIYYWALSVLFCRGFLLTRNKGLSYPMNNVMGIVFLYFVIKYVAYYLLNIPPLHGLSIDEFGRAGRNLLLFFVPAYTLFYACKLLVGDLRLRRYEFVERVDLGIASYLAIGGLLALAVTVEGVGVLRSPLQMRGFTTHQGIEYFSLVAEFAVTYYSFRLLYDGAYRRLALLSLVFSVFAFVSGRASLQVAFVLRLLFFMNACYRRPILRYCAVLAVVGVPYVLLTGVYRDMTRVSAVSWEEFRGGLQAAVNSGMLEYQMTRALYRIDDLEELALLSNEAEHGELNISYGGRMSDLLYQWVPRHFWPDKPLTFTMAMTRWFHPDVYYVAQGGNNFTGIGELLFNFGLPGVLGGGILFGIMMYWSCAMWEACAGSLGMTFLQFGLIQPYLSLALLAGFVNDLALPTLLVNAGLMILLLKPCDREATAISRSVLIGSRAPLLVF